MNNSPTSPLCNHSHPLLASPDRLFNRSLTLSATARSSVCVPALAVSYVWTWLSSILLTLPLLTRLMISTSPRSATPLYADSGLLGDSRTPSLTLGDCGPKNVRSSGKMDGVDLALGEVGWCSWERFFWLAFAGSGGGTFAFGSGRELAMDFSFEMKDTIFALLAMM
jgi:hypothetical protein